MSLICFIHDGKEVSSREVKPVGQRCSQDSQPQDERKYARYEDGACITTNGIESAFSLLSRGIIGSWHIVSAKHLPAYFEEMTFRFNRRNSETFFLETLQHMITSDPWTFERLTA
jgi:hypothetical protein